MNWGDNLSMVGAMRLTGWLTLATYWGAINTHRFVAWVRRRLAPRLAPGDVVVMDNLAAHKARAVRDLIEAAWAEVQFLPPYSYDALVWSRSGESGTKVPDARLGHPNGVTEELTEAPHSTSTSDTGRALQTPKTSSLRGASLLYVILTLDQW